MVPGWTDLAIAAGFVVLTGIESVTADPDGTVWRVLALLLLAWRHSFPELVAVVIVLTAVFTDHSGELSVTLAIVLVAYTIGSDLPARRAALGVTGVTTLLFIASWLLDVPPSPSDVAALFVLCLAPGLVGMGQHARVQREMGAVASAAAAEERRLIDMEEAASRERARIARELHDVVSHSLTVVTINTQAVRRSLDPRQVREIAALSMIESTAREASTEMRRLFGVLRPDGATPLQPQPGLSQLPVLIERLRTAGLVVDLQFLQQDDMSSPLPAAVDVTAYRIVQEAVTNVLRHANASRVAVRVRPGTDRLVIEVEDDGDGLASAVEAETTGRGLVGIVERAQVFGGQASFGSTGHGFRVRVSLPSGVAP